MSLGLHNGLATPAVSSGSGFLLDDFPGAAVAYSLRKLSSTATSPITVREKSGDTTSAISFDGNSVDEAAIATHCGAALGKVSQWTDQTGNANHATTGTLNQEPQIYDGAAVETDGGEPAANFITGGLERLNFSNSGWNIGSLSVFIVLRFTSTASSRFGVFGSASPNRFYIPFLNGGNFNFSYAGSTTAVVVTADTTEHLFTGIAGATQGNFSAFLDGGLEGTASRSTNAVSGAASLGSTSGVEGFIKEMIVYDSDQSANRSGIESNINAYYSIY